MKLEIIKKTKLKRPPTSICSTFDRIYVATKGKRVFMIDNKTCEIKSIKFTKQVNTIATDKEILFCGQVDGNIFGLNDKHKTIFKANSGDSKIVYSKFFNDLFIGNENGKLSIFGVNSLLKNTLYFNENSIQCFDTFETGKLAVIFQNCQMVEVVDLNCKERIQIKISDGYPEIIKILTEDKILIGTAKGSVAIYSITSKKKITFLRLNSRISSIHLLDVNTFVIGTVECNLNIITVSDYNKMILVDTLITDGIPVDMCINDDKIYCAVSRESRLGRWNTSRKSHNMILNLKVGN